MDKLLARILHQLECLEMKWTRLEDRVDVIEERTCANFNRLDEVEEWQEKVDDKLELDE